jgi:hypothetical protein
VLWTLVSGGALSCLLVWGFPAAMGVVVAGLAASAIL